jgi:uncharacterized protein (TIGR03435 family)
MRVFTTRAAGMGVVLAVALRSALLAQAPAFEVASVRPSAEGLPTAGAGVHIRERQFRASFLSIRDYIGIAFKLRPQQILAPAWTASTRFDVVATIPDGSGEHLPAMIQALLADRFQLRVHHERRDFDVYGLEIAKDGPPLVRLPDEAPPEGAFNVTSSSAGGEISADLGNGASLTVANNRFDMKRITMPALADTLGRFMDRPVVDMTRLEGRYNVGFDVAADDYYPMLIRSAFNAGIQLPAEALRLLDAPSTGSVPDALKKVGLSLSPRRLPLDVLVVDTVQRTPTEN